MEAVIFTGIQATGKSTFYKDKFFKTHIRINLDMLKTRHREQLMLDACIKAKQPFVVDNTNSTALERTKYIELAKSAGFKVIGYYFQSNIEDAVSRNKERQGKECIPIIGIRYTHSKLEIPKFEEGFEALYYVSIQEKGFIVEEWKYEV